MHILLILLILPNRVTLCGDSTWYFPLLCRAALRWWFPLEARREYCMSTGLIQGALIGRRAECGWNQNTTEWREPGETSSVLLIWYCRNYVKIEPALTSNVICLFIWNTTRGHKMDLRGCYGSSACWKGGRRFILQCQNQMEDATPFSSWFMGCYVSDFLFAIVISYSCYPLQRVLISRRVTLI